MFEMELYRYQIDRSNHLNVEEDEGRGERRREKKVKENSWKKMQNDADRLDDGPYIVDWYLLYISLKMFRVR